MRATSRAVAIAASAALVVLPGTAASADPLTDALQQTTTTVTDAVTQVTAPLPAPVATPVQESVKTITETVSGTVKQVETVVPAAPQAPTAETPGSSPRTEQRPAQRSSTSSTSSPPQQGEEESPARADADADLGPAGSLCLRVPGPSGAPADADVVLVGEAVLDRLREQSPELRQLFGECAEDLDTAGVVHIDLDEVAELCLRLDPDGTDVLALTLLLQDTDLLDELDAAGLPLRDYIADCLEDEQTAPGGGTPGTGSGGGGGGGSTDGQGTQVLGSKIPATATAGDRLPFTGGPIAVLAGLGLLTVAGGGLLYRAGLVRRG